MINKGKEVGGTHYADMRIEPIELIEALDLGFIQGSIIKYISRYKNKNGIEDLNKALHYCDIAKLEMNNIYRCIDFTGKNKFIVKMYCGLNGLSDMENMIIGYAISGDYESCSREIQNLITKIERR